MNVLRAVKVSADTGVRHVWYTHTIIRGSILEKQLHNFANKSRRTRRLTASSALRQYCGAGTFAAQYVCVCVRDLSHPPSWCT